MPVPYDVSFELNVFVSNSDDGLQIIEQILPYFQPDYTVTMIEDAQWIQKEIYLYIRRVLIMKIVIQVH